MKYIEINGVRHKVTDYLGYNHSVGAYVCELEYNGVRRMAVRQRGGQWRLWTAEDKIRPLAQDAAMSAHYIPASVTMAEAQTAAADWGANCGPGALAAVLDLKLGDVRLHLNGFDGKRYTNPLMMFGALRSLGISWRRMTSGWPIRGLMRIQWEGPWMDPGVSPRARYRHTHWIASRRFGGRQMIYDINCSSVGWVPIVEWRDKVAPWLIRECEPQGNGRWHPTHRLGLYL